MTQELLRVDDAHVYRRLSHPPGRKLRHARGRRRRAARP